MHKTSMVFCIHKITGRHCAFVFVCTCVNVYVCISVCVCSCIYRCMHALYIYTHIPVQENYRINNKPENHRDRFTDNRACSFIV